MDKYIVALGTILTIILAVLKMRYTRKQNSLKVIPMPNGDIKVYNPKRHTVIIHNIIAKEGTLRWEIANVNGEIQMGDSGEICKSFNRDIASNKEQYFPTGIYLGGKRYTVYGKIRRTKFFEDGVVDIILFPDKPIVY